MIEKILSGCLSLHSLPSVRNFFCFFKGQSARWTKTCHYFKKCIFTLLQLSVNVYFHYVTGGVLKHELPCREKVTKANWSSFHASVKECFVFVLPTLHSGAGSLDCSACLWRGATLGRDTGGRPRLFGGDALIVVGPGHKGHWNKRPLLRAERAFCPLDRVQRLWEYLFFFSTLDILTYPQTTAGSIHAFCWMKWRFIWSAISWCASKLDFFIIASTVYFSFCLH